jgi:hypothetical protein
MYSFVSPECANRLLPAAAAIALLASRPVLRTLLLSARCWPIREDDEAAEAKSRDAAVRAAIA